MILLSRTLSKLEMAFVPAYVNHLQNLYRENKSPKAVASGAIKEFISFAAAGQAESIEQYCRFLPPTSKFDSAIFWQITSFVNMVKKPPEVLMALSAYYSWKASEVAVLSKNTATEGAPVDYAKNFNLASEDYEKKALASIQHPTIYTLDPLAQGYLLNKNSPESVAADSALAVKMSNFRNRLLAEISKIINEEKKFKYTLAFVENLIKFASPAEYSKHKNIITSLFSDAQKPSFRVGDANANTARFFAK